MVADGGGFSQVDPREGNRAEDAATRAEEGRAFMYSRLCLLGDFE